MISSAQKITGLMAGALLAVSLGWIAAAVERPKLPDAAAQIGRGREIYMRDCASCHGVHLEGQKNWDKPGPNGRFPAPPHDASGHTWQHSDAELHELIAHSVYAYTAPGYQSDMPAFAGILSDMEITAVIDFLKSTWPPGMRAWQQAQTTGKINLKDLPLGWKFPALCRFHNARGSAG